MSRRDDREGMLVVAGSVLAALVLTVVPLPVALEPFRPYWVALVMIYWHLESGRLHGLGPAFALGLVVDVLTGALLGRHALSLVILNFLLRRFRNRIRFFPPWQQALAVGALLLNDRVVHLWVVGLLERSWPGWAFWLPPLVGMALWPWLFLLLDGLRSRRRGGRA
ncbi:rod shape-determining protein MreD [Wenzhouxiangella sp. XN79A]|uniref:rod shape-determining protein MreD n=1 Tax=Wenzhouxiangella sp. XN79A TaxID=2724193 RepID=UPI00144AD292|nr:rod shape-determining protein MreD [Wenzhouxiangella sp. XN79A]NKI33963.1 rod shape-determining protein MreD [Wenzhouxiangella sp. XN79A]